MSGAYLGLAGLDAIFLVTGYTLLYALGLVRLRLGDARLLGLSFLAGWALLASVLTLSLIAGVELRALTVVVAGAALSAAFVLIGRRRQPEPLVPVRQSRHPLALLAAGLGAAILMIEVAAALVVSVKNEWTTDLDVITAWLPRARTIYYLHHLNASVWGVVPHAGVPGPWYPPLVPAMYASTFDFAGGFHPAVLPLQQVVLGIAFLLAVLGLVDRFTPRWLSLPALALLVTTPWFWWRLHSLLPDQTVAYLLVGAALTCVLWLYERRSAWLWLAVVFLAAASLAKVEGALFGAILAVVVIGAGLALYRRAGLPACVLLLAPATFVPWRLWLIHNHVPTSNPAYNAPGVLHPGFLADRLHRLGYALQYMLRAPFVEEQLTAVVIVFFVAALLIAGRRLPVLSGAVAVWLALSFFSLATIYWAGGQELHWYLSTSAARVGTTLIIAGGTVAPLLLGLAMAREARALEAGAADVEADP